MVFAAYFPAALLQIKNSLVLVQAHLVASAPPLLAALLKAKKLRDSSVERTG
jgi:hypothetical protein